MKARVSQGGHDVPKIVIGRRFAAGLRNFDAIYRQLVNSWAMYDNTDGGLSLIASGENA